MTTMTATTKTMTTAMKTTTTSQTNTGMVSKSSVCNGINIEHCSIGNPENPPVLLIMGLGGSMADWNPFDKKLADYGFHVIKFDNRDVGCSQRFDDMIPDQDPDINSSESDDVFAYTIDDMADDAVAVLDYYKISKAHVIGASMGGLITQVVGTRYPKRCITLTPIMTSYSLRDASNAAFTQDTELLGRLMKLTKPKECMSLEEYIDCKLAMNAIFSVDPSNPIFSEETKKRTKQNATTDFKRNGIDWDGAGTNRQAEAIRGWEKFELEAHKGRLESIDIPTVVLHGVHDSLIPVSYGRQLADKIPRSRFVEYVGNHSFGNHPDVGNFILDVIVDHISQTKKQ